jgi:hypothetical protein
MPHRDALKSGGDTRHLAFQAAPRGSSWLLENGWHAA